MRQNIRVVITNWINVFNNGDQLRTTDVVAHVHKYIGRYIDPGTIRREMRFLRADGLINYKSVGLKSEKIIRIIK